MIKKFNEMYSEDDILGTIRDILDSQILDEFDVELGKFGHSTEKSYSCNEFDTYSYIFTNDRYLVNVDGYGIEVGDPNEDDECFLIRKQKFIFIELLCDKNYLLENLSIIDSIKSSINMISSICHIELTNMVDITVRNSISCDEWSHQIEVDWKNPNTSKILKFLKGKMSDEITIQIIFKSNES